MVRDFLSGWAARYAGASRASFEAACPHPFLIWEPGPWMPKGAGETARPSPSDNPLAGLKVADRAVVIPLALAPGQARLVLGRAPECDVSINDGSLSRTHLALVPAGAGFTVEELGSRNGSSLGGRRLSPGRPEVLTPGAQLLAGSIYLTYLDPAGMFERLRSGS